MMRERGFITVDRGIFDHPMFAKDPFTEREAWLWLISEAAWKNTRVRAGGSFIELKRGQLAHSLRFMAAKWGWSEPRVRRFLARLKNDAMIDVVATQRATHITICNYDKFQLERRNDNNENDTPSDAEATQRRINKQDISLRSISADDDDTRDRVAGGCDRPARIDVADGFDRPAHIDVAVWINSEIRSCFDTALPCHDHARIRQWLERGADFESHIKPAVKRMLQRAHRPPSRFSYFENGIADEIQALSKPILGPNNGNATRKNQQSRREGRLDSDVLMAAFARRAGGGNAERMDEETGDYPGADTGGKILDLQAAGGGWRGG